MLYADYGYYTTQYQGTVLDEADFFSAMRQASAFLRGVTFGRGEGCGLPALKDCACAVAELLWRFREREGIASENNDGYSVAYEPGGGDKQIMQAVLSYLGDTGLLYKGAGPC